MRLLRLVLFRDIKRSMFFRDFSQLFLLAEVFQQFLFLVENLFKCGASGTENVYETIVHAISIFTLI